MNKLFLISIFFLHSYITKGQNTLVEDVSSSVCKCVDQNKTFDDSERMRFCFMNALVEVKGLSLLEAPLDSIFIKADYLLSKTCPEYIDIAARLYSRKSDWVRLDSNLTSKLDSVTCRQIFNYKKLYYVEVSGDTSTLSVHDSMYVELIGPQQYYSKCKFKWTSYCDFELEFIESNHPFKGKYSKPGDKYYYRLIDKTPSYYVITVHYGTIWKQFKIYYS